MKPGRFISIEGVEGVGKSTNLAFIMDLLTDHGITFITTREPGGTELGEKIRTILLDNTQHEMTATTELLLMFASRAQLVEKVIKPAIANGKWVICDRFTDSSYAYQGGGRGLSMSKIESVEALAIDKFQPDCTIMLDLAVDQGLLRAEKVGDKDRFENEQIDFFNRVRKVFLDRAQQLDRCHIIDASRPLDKVQAEISRVLTDFIGQVDV